MTTGTIDSNLKHHLDGQLLTYAVQQAICCGGCGQVLDKRRAILLSHDAAGFHQVGCVKCVEVIVLNFAAKAFDPNLTDKQRAAYGGLEVYDGRELHGRCRR